MAFSNSTYDILKWIAQYLLPGLGTLYFALSGIWGLPYGEQIVGTITAIDAFLGLLLGISTNGYKGDGTMSIDDKSEDKTTYNLDLNIPVEELAEKKTITFKVNNK